MVARPRLPCPAVEYKSFQLRRPPGPRCRPHAHHQRIQDHRRAGRLPRHRLPRGLHAAFPALRLPRRPLPALVPHRRRRHPLVSRLRRHRTRFHLRPPPHHPLLRRRRRSSLRPRRPHTHLRSLSAPPPRRRPRLVLHGHPRRQRARLHPRRFRRRPLGLAHGLLRRRPARPPPRPPRLPHERTPARRR